MKKDLNRYRPSGMLLLALLSVQLLLSEVADAQLITLSAPTTGEYSSNQSIRLLPGFSTSGPFRAYITGNLNVQLGSAPSTDRNYIRTRTYKEPSLTGFADPSVNQVSEVVQYVDGLGRPLQTVQTKGSPLGNDIVQPVVYDVFGREAVKYLPYAEQSGNGSYKTTALSTQSQYYSSPGWDDAVAKTTAPYSQTVFEPSPLNRVNEQGAPGTVWQPAGGTRDNSTGRTVVVAYGANDASGAYSTTGYAVRLWTSSPISAGAYQRSLGTPGFYGAGALSLKITKDENWTSGDGKAGTVEEYTDKEGHVVLKRTFNIKDAGVEVLSTYYVYDDWGNLSFVLPPGSNPDAGSISQTILDQYCYQYYYDGRNRVIEKRVPGTDGWTTYVYNKLDQVVFSQDILQYNQQKTSFTKYDGLGRVIMTGTGLNSVLSRAATQDVVNNWPANWEYRDNSSTFHGYSNQSVPSTVESMEVETVNYYDDYDIPGLPVNESASFSNQTNGLLTATKTRVLGSANVLLWTVNYYDENGRLAKQYKQHYQSGTVNAGNYDETSNSYNFEGALTASTRLHHSTTSGTTTIAIRYEYDHVGRKLRAYENINGGGEVLLSENRYNEVGQLRTKELNGGQQQTSYAYNERGWLKNSSSGQFSMQLNYQDGGTPQFNGNISGQLWGPGTLSNSFNYSYDKLNRLTSGATTGMSEILSYDVMGNIQSLNRDGVTRSYAYSGNRLSSTSGAAGTGTYGYDANGNTIYDGRLGQAVTYNRLNLPESVPGLGLSYIYDATGNKLRKTSGGNVTNYVDGIQYKTDGTIDFIQTEEGLARNSGGAYSYEYTLTDHLGNTRVTFYKNPSGALEVLQRDDYYPFGLRKPSFASSNENKYLYNGKELQEELGQYDYGARFYDPVIGRWNVVDPMAEKYASTNPYNYVDNNPILRIDPNGMESNSTHTDKLGKVLAVYDDGDLGVYKHDDAKTKGDVDKNYSKDNTSAGGQKMGETWTSLGFADFGYYEDTGKIRVQAGAQIDFNSNWATEQVSGILNRDPSAAKYASKAGGGQDWDIKTHSPGGIGYGSKLFGKYASARDAGNFAAGAVAANSYWPGFMIDYGFGLYNMSGNSVSRSIGNASRDATSTPAGIIGSIFIRGRYGESNLSQKGIDVGKGYMQKILNQKGGASSYFKSF